LQDELNKFLSDGFRNGARNHEVIMRTPRSKLAVGYDLNWTDPHVKIGYI
jgi:hypothetical protein